MMVVELGQWLWFFSDGLGTNLVTLDLHDQLNSIFKNACWSTLAWFDSNSSIFIKQQLHSITTSSDLEYAEYASYATFVSFCLRGAVASSTCVSTSAGPDLSTFKNLAPFLCDIHVETSVQGKQFLLKLETVAVFITATFILRGLTSAKLTSEKETSLKLDHSFKFFKTEGFGTLRSYLSCSYLACLESQFRWGVWAPIALFLALTWANDG